LVIGRKVVNLKINTINTIYNGWKRDWVKMPNAQYSERYLQG
jgi:hypothetical protein